MWRSECESVRRECEGVNRECDYGGVSMVR